LGQNHSANKFIFMSKLNSTQKINIFTKLSLNEN
jgi:hypothetical protein